MSALGLFSDINNLPIAPYKPTDFGEVIQSSLYGTSQRTEFGIVPTLETSQDYIDRQNKLKERFSKDELKKIEGNDEELRSEALRMDAEKGVPFYQGYTPNINLIRNKKVDEAILAGRQTDPARWNDIKTTDEIQEQKKDRARAAINSAAEISSKATTFDSIAGGLIGGLGGAFTDPINIATLPLGATSGMGILKAMKAEALLNAGVEAVEAPFVSKWQKELGFKYGIGDSAIDIATAGAGGAAFVGIVRGARPTLEALGRGINKTTQYTKEKSLPILQKIGDSEILPSKVKDAAKYMSRVAHIDEEMPSRQAVNGEIKTNIDPQEIAQHRQILQDTQDSFDNYREPIYDKEVIGNVKDYSDAELFEQYKAVSTELNQLPKPKRLLQFLKETGGIKDEAGELANYGITTKSYPGLLRKDGQNNSIDYARERAVEAGYLPEETTTSDFLEAIREDYVNRNVFNEDGQAISFKRSNLEDGLRQLDEHFGNKGINLRDKATTKRLALQGKLEKQQAGLRQRAEPIAKDELTRIENEINQAGFDKETSKLYSQAFRSFYETQLARGNMESKKVLDEAFSKLRVEKGEVGKQGSGKVFEQSKNITKTKAFKKWFGDSKVVDGKGEPLVVYHGSKNKSLEEFKNEFKGLKSRDILSYLGFHFSPDSKMVERNFDDKPIAAYLRIKNPLTINEGDLVKKVLEFADKNGKIDKKKVDLEKLLKLPYFNANKNSIANELQKDAWESLKDRKINYPEISNDYLNHLKEKGYDGIKYLNEIEWAADKRYDYIAFDSSQIKSVKNKGTFDPNNPNILFQSSVNEFQQRVFAAQELGDSLGKKLKINSDGSITLYHGTSKQNADKILKSGELNEGTYFSVNKGGTKYGDSPLDVAKRKFGKDGIVMEIKLDARNLESAAAGSEVFSPEKLIKGEDGVWRQEDLKTLFQRQGENAKGSIEFNAPDGKTIINLFEGKDLSTLLHETGHFFLETQKLLANVANAPDDLKADWQTTLDWLGSKDGNFTRDQHEQFARGFEAYLREGNAPSPELIGVFERFKQWLTNIYKDFKELGVNVSDEMRGVFDRMLATDEQIERVSMFDGPEQDLVFRPNDALASMERDVADLETLGDDVYNADFERLLKEQPDLEIETPDGRMTIREIADQIKEDDNVLSAIKTCAIGGK